MEKLSTQAILDAGLHDWRKLAQGVHARYLVPDLATGAAFVAAVAEAADAAGHHPDVRMTYATVDLSLCTHDAGRWVTEKDVDLARRITAIAGEHGLAADPGAVTQIELAVDTAHEALLGPFWSAVLTGSPDDVVRDTVFDPTNRVPSVWFQPTDEHETPRQRWHYDLWVAPEVAQQRIAAGVAAGGTVVDDAEAPAFTVLADPDGNKVCICTYLGRA